MPSNYRKLGSYIQVVNIRNKDLSVSTLLGVSIKKGFMPSIANTVGTNMGTYKIVKRNQFAYGPVTSRNGDKISIALLQEYDEVIISQAYVPFEVIDHEELDPEYLMMWFRRPEFDRYARFMSHGSARETFDWDEMREVELPIPHIDTQRAIVKEYNTITDRIKLNEQLNQKLEETAQTLYRQWFVDFEFPFDFTTGKPDMKCKPYKSSGGEMVWCEEFEKEIPRGWRVGLVGDLFILQRGHDLPIQSRITGEFPIFASTGITGFHNDFKISKPTIVTGRSGSLGELFYYDQPCWPLNTTLYVKQFKSAVPFYSLYFLKTINLKEMGSGSAVPTLNRNDVHSILKELPEKSVMDLFDRSVSSIHVQMSDLNKQSQMLERLSGLLLSKMSTVDEGVAGSVVVG